VTEYDHETLDHACDEIIPALAAVGITHKWITPMPVVPTNIRVGCVLTHVLGHSDSPVEFEGPPDDSGGKNALQARKSTVTYLERTTLLAATGLAPENADDDGQGGAKLKLDNLGERLEWIANCRDLPELERIYKDAARAALAANDSPAILKLGDAKDKRKRELERR
jgi:hypothetical protein